MPGRLTTALLALQTQRLFSASLVTSLSLHTFSHFPKVLLSAVFNAFAIFTGDVLALFFIKGQRRSRRLR